MGRPKRSQLHLPEPQPRNRASNLPHEKRNEPTTNLSAKNFENEKNEKEIL
jgi:hypothetical protein